MQVEFIENGVVVSTGEPGIGTLDTVQIANNYVIVCHKKMTGENKNEIVNDLINMLWKTKAAREKRYLK